MGIVNSLKTKLRSTFYPSPVLRVGRLNLLNLTESLDQPTATGKGIIEPNKANLYRGFGFDAIFQLKNKEPDQWLSWKRSYLKVPIVTAAVDLTTDNVVQGFYLKKSSNTDSDLELDEINLLIHDFNLLELFHNVTKQMLIYGNAFVEVVRSNGRIVDLKILDPVVMYVNRDKYGNFPSEKAYFQYFNDQAMQDGKNPIFFDYTDIVHFKWNPLGESAYGNGMIAPLFYLLGGKLDTEDMLLAIIKRYAAPIHHVKVGTPEEPAQQVDINLLRTDFQDIFADTEYVTDHRVSIEVLGSQNKAMDLEAPLTYIEHQVVAGLQIPLVLLGRSSERASAEVQLATFDRRIKSIQRFLKRIIEQQFFAVHLDSVGMEPKNTPELVFGDPEERITNEAITTVIDLKNSGIITAQKANELLPEEYHEDLPEELKNPQQFAAQNMNNPNKPGNPSAKTPDKQDPAERKPTQKRVSDTRDKREPN